MKNVLMVAEKPSLAASLATILSNGRCTVKRGTGNGCSTHEWTGTFRNEGTVHFRMTSVCGHVMSLDFTSKYNSWDKVDPVELFGCPTEKKETSPKQHMRTFLAHEARGCEYLVLWLDCDKEGENICFEVMDAVQGVISNVYSKQVTYRAHFSAITDKDIKGAMETLGHPNENEAKSVDARQELDLRIGCAFTRFQTRFFQDRYGDLDSSLISYGPCQTPTLGFCVKRHDDIQTFKPESFWYLQMLAGQPEFTLEWGRGRVFKKDIAIMLLNRVKEHKEATVESVSSKEAFKSKPLALNTVELMRICSSGLGIGPFQAMQIAERLYTQGYVSYPRTETNQYPENFDLPAVLRVLQPSGDFGDEARLILGDIQAPRKGKDAGDHPPITPMKLANRSDFDRDTWRVYEFICRHFMGTLSRDLKYRTTTAKLKVGMETFSCTANVLLDQGYTKVMTWLAFGRDEPMPPFVQGTQVAINDVRLAESQTGPPDYLTEAELITLMEQHGIGTDASIPVHINNICQRNYVRIENGRKLIPTTLGIVLVHGYTKIDPELVLPTMRSEVERMLTLIAKGTADFQDVLRHAITIFKLKFMFYVKNIASMDALFEVSFSPLAESGKAHSRCGKCRRYMKYIQTKPARLYCSHCDETYALPNGNVKVYREFKCPLDDFELLAFSTGVKGKSFPFCPYCYNHPPFSDMPSLGGCNTCTHATCPHSLNTLGISGCVECPTGILVLDSTLAPTWKLGCNRCDVIINCFKGATKITVEEAKCAECGAQQVNVVYKSDKSKFKDGTEEKIGCVFCSSDFSHLVEKHRAVASRPVRSGGPRGGKGGRGGVAGVAGAVAAGGEAAAGGRGGGGGRGGRGRGPPKDKMAQLAAYFV
ncbi:DNA topoisomerase 3-beta [Drosophila subobscura]|uniref:DNA topoisomerase 3-beta n=1 Tax=Drosophila subobscura TaxID=7241 RepID=UPI00155AE3A9|nr:DNA topoisomerase 3-beta [Drosophila subobscura]